MSHTEVKDNKSTLYINKRQPRKTMSNTQFVEDLIYQAHTLDEQGFVPYVPRSRFEKAIIAMRSGDAEVIKKTLADLGES